MLPLLRYLPDSTVRAAFAESPELRFFDEHEAAVVEAATARLIPGPDDDPDEEGHPGAREAGVVHYIDLMLSAFDDDPPLIYAGGPWSDRRGGPDNDMATFIPLSDYEREQWEAEIAGIQELYFGAVDQLDAAAGGDFAAASPNEQDAILAGAEQTDVRRLLFTHAIEGMYANPEYGGNKGLVGWEDTRFAGDVAPTGWTDAEVSESDGDDPAPEDVRLPFPAEVAESATEGEGGPVISRPKSRNVGPSRRPATSTAHISAEQSDAALEEWFAAALPLLSKARQKARPGRRR